mmetsp:Transcript_141567/g.244773  ORF Transcript_141567/g.244773 Transcript_141567/m.244773 type:complete len:430 (+) Transcript_141567:32-1321(+)
MSHRRAIYAARFLRPPGWTKRLLLREKPRELTGPYENPVRRWVRLREKARQFCEIPPPAKVPVPKPSHKKMLQAVEGVPRVRPDVLQRRLDFLLSPAASEQQLAAPLRAGLSPYTVELRCWERQMRELRRIYRAQYLQKLAEVTEIERKHEAEMYQRELEERKRRKQAHLQKIGEDMKRRAILKDRKRVEAKVTEAIEMARRSKAKRQRLYWFRRMENFSKLIVSAENIEEAVPSESAISSTDTTATADAGALGGTGALLSRNVSVPFLLRQLGGAKAFPQQRSRRMPRVANVQREILESSYDILPEDEPRFEPAPAGGPSERERAAQLYGGFSEKEKLELLNQKIDMLDRQRKINDSTGKQDHITQRLYDELMAVRLSYQEGETQAELKAASRAARGEDPTGLPSGTSSSFSDGSNSAVLSGSGRRKP